MSQTVRNTLQLQIDQLTREILNATGKAWESQKNQDPKKNIFWLEEKKILSAERSELQKKLRLTPSQSPLFKPKTRREIKDRIISLNAMARIADEKMRLALEDKQLSQANTFLQQRNQFNAESSHLMALLNPADDKTANKIKKNTPLSREQIKVTIKDYKIKSTEADKQMRKALSDRKLEKANELLQQRNYLNAEIKELTAKLVPDEKQTASVDQPHSLDNTKNAPTPRQLLIQKIKAYHAKAIDTDTKIKSALSDKRLIDANDLLQQKNKFNEEANKLLNELKLMSSNTTIHYDEKPVLTREEIIAKVQEANKKALEANAAIQAALKIKEYEKANAFLKQRKAFNAEAKKLTLMLPPIASVAEKTDRDLSIDPALQDLPFATRVAQHYINYRLRFLKHFYKKQEIEAQIEAEKKKVCTITNDTIEDLNDTLQAHVRCPPSCYVEDNAHNDIILYLLDKTDEFGAPFFNFPEITAKNMGTPLKPLSCHQDLTDFISRYTEEDEGKRVLLKYFIRDIIQVKCSLTLCDLVFHDAIMDTAHHESGFVYLFDQAVKEINKEIVRLQGESQDPLMPSVLRPINNFAALNHRDAIQLIPPYQNGIDQFSGAILEDTTIQDNIITSSAKLQGIFSSDGAFHNLKIINNRIVTQGEHKISILGMLSGEITENTDLDGNEVDIRIQPLRLGGGTPLTNFFVLSFTTECSYQYGHIEGISETPLDRRSKKVVRGKEYDPRKYLLNFDMDSFIAHYRAHEKPHGRFETIHDIVQLMVAEEGAVLCNQESLDALEKGATVEQAMFIAQQPLLVNNPVIQGCKPDDDPRIQKPM